MALMLLHPKDIKCEVTMNTEIAKIKSRESEKIKKALASIDVKANKKTATCRRSFYWGNCNQVVQVLDLRDPIRN